MPLRLAHRLLTKPSLAALLLLALLGRSLVPVGYMPGPGGLMLCPAYGPGQEAVASLAAMHMPGHDMSGVDMSGMSHDMGTAGGRAGHAGMGHEVSCSYATAASAAALATVYSQPPVAYSPSIPDEVLPPAERPIPRGAIDIGRIDALECAAIAADEQTVWVVLLRREGENLLELLDRLERRLSLGLMQGMPFDELEQALRPQRAGAARPAPDVAEPVALHARLA